jgi:Tol biopolymer transport system component
MGRLPGKPWQVYLISVEGGSAQQLTTEEHSYADPGWSPDGGSLIYDRLLSIEPDGSRVGGIYLLDLKTRQVSMLPDSKGFFSPLWSPDGRYIAAQPLDAHNQVIYDFETRKWQDLTDLRPGYPNWSRDGKYLYFDSFMGKDSAFYRLRISDRKAERLVSLKDIQRVDSGLGSWTGLAPDDSPLTLREIGTQEIYALDVDLP